MEASSRAARKRPREPAQCCFCGKTPASVLVDFGTTARRSNKKLPYCWLHYYTTRAVRMPHVEPLTSTKEESSQAYCFNEIQPLFARAFVELQQELSETAARAHAFTKSDDPLAVLHDLRGKPKKPKGIIANKRTERGGGGGFLRNVPIPERMRRQQELQKQAEQRKQQASQFAASTMRPQETVNPYKRRKSSRKSIWNLAMESSAKTATTVESGKAAAATLLDEAATGVVCSSCSGNRVVNAGNVTTAARQNMALTKGETWGNKDRSDTLVMRYQCQDCGKIWNEEE